MATLNNYNSIPTGTFNQISFEEYIKYKTSYIKKQFITENHNGVLKKKLNKNILIKYSPCVESFKSGWSFKKESIEKLSLLFDLIFNYENETGIYKSSNAQIEVTKLEDKLKKSLSKKSTIKNKVYNYLNNCVEYELEDGNFVQINNDDTLSIEIELDDSIFPIDLLKEFDLNVYRNSIIKMIIDENR